MGTMTARADLILEAVDALVDRLLVVDRELDDELHEGDVETAIVKGEITVERIAHRFAVVLCARTPYDGTPPAGSLRQLAEENDRLRSLLAEYGADPFAAFFQADPDTPVH